MAAGTRTAIVVASLLLLTQPAAATTPGPSPAAARYALSLGDSLAVGFQPTGPAEDDHRTDQGYPDQLAAIVREVVPGLQLVKLGCPGESTVTITQPNDRCPRPAGSQLDEALAFIAAHPGEIDYITIDIGFADFSCDDVSCLGPGLAAIETNLPPVLAALRAAAPTTPLIGMTIYDPFLPAWLDGDETLARMSVPIVGMINDALTTAYLASGAAVADVADAFSTTDFTTLAPGPDGIAIPRNVAQVCAWTWLCVPPPLGPDRHANEAGHAAIAAAFWAQLEPLVAAGR